MNIALISHEYPPFRGGGIGTYTQVMGDLFAGAGHQVHIICNQFDYGSTNPNHGSGVHQEGNLCVHRIPAWTDDHRPRPPHTHNGDTYFQLERHWDAYLYYAEMVAEEMEKICRQHRIDVAEFPECAAEAYGVIRRKRHRLAFLDLPVTVTLHSPIWEIYQYNLYSRYNAGFRSRTYMEEYTIRHADRVNSPTSLLAKIAYRRLGLCADRSPCDVVPLPLDFASMDKLIPPPAVATAADPSLLFVGRLEPRKGVRYLIDAAVRVMSDHPKLTVTLVGKDCDAGEVPGKMTQFLLSRIPEELQANFKFTGVLPRSELFTLFGKATACVFAAPWDNFPFACCEAMASRACVIGSDFSGMADMIEHEKSGLLFKTRDVDALAACIERVVTNPDFVARVREEAPRRIRQICDPDRIMRLRLEHYERTIDSHRQRAASRAKRLAAITKPARPKVALRIADSDDQESLRETIASAQSAAAHAGAELQISIKPAFEHLDVNEGEGADRIASDQAWTKGLADSSPDYLLKLHSGETVQKTFLTVMMAQFDEIPKLAWASSWATAGVGDVVYAGWDFSMPLYALDYRPVPISLLRYDTFMQIGAWNWELPPTWRDWDLWFALASAGFEGVVLPAWLCRYQPRPDLQPIVPAQRETFTHYMEMMVERSPAIFASRGTDLWLDRQYNSISTSPQPSFTAQLDSRRVWHDWRALTLTMMARQFPRLARVYRSVLRR
jgi:glycogen(starch) synthase